MPNATVDGTGVKRVDLQTLEGAYVILRKQTFGMRKHRDDIVTRVTMQAADRKGVPDIMQMDIRNADVALYDFRTSIVEHNLEDESGRTLDLSSPKDLQLLLPEVGEEIEYEIRKFNRFDEAARDEELSRFQRSD
jgi:hypothetical protein